MADYKSIIRLTGSFENIFRWPKDDEISRLTFKLELEGINNDNVKRLGSCHLGVVVNMCYRGGSRSQFVPALRRWSVMIRRTLVVVHRTAVGVMVECKSFGVVEEVHKIVGVSGEVEVLAGKRALVHNVAVGVLERSFVAAGDAAAVVVAVGLRSGKRGR